MFPAEVCDKLPCLQLVEWLVELETSAFSWLKAPSLTLNTNYEDTMLNRH